jgi:hypothetical protein
MLFMCVFWIFVVLFCCCLLLDLSDLFKTLFWIWEERDSEELLYYDHKIRDLKFAHVLYDVQ